MWSNRRPVLDWWQAPEREKRGRPGEGAALFDSLFALRVSTVGRSSTTWQPGESGNPNGRPLIASRYKRILREIADEHTGWTNEEKIAHVFVEQAKKGSLAAWEHVLERVEGKVPDETKNTGEVKVRVVFEERRPADGH